MRAHIACWPRTPGEPARNCHDYTEDHQTLQPRHQVVEQGVPENPRSPAKDRTGELINEESFADAKSPRR